VPRERLLHVAQSLFHDHVPAKRHGLASVWINRRHDRPGWGATPEPSGEYSYDLEYPTMEAFPAAARKAKAEEGRSATAPRPGPHRRNHWPTSCSSANRRTLSSIENRVRP